MARNVWLAEFSKTVLLNRGDFNILVTANIMCILFLDALFRILEAYETYYLLLQR